MNCKAHNRGLEFFCEDDEQLACSYCAVMGPHKGHALIALAQKVRHISFIKIITFSLLPYSVHLFRITFFVFASLR